ncbi:hypothetical protein BV25DRAFT_1821604, partial [Artomyces pyxidatus]
MPSAWVCLQSIDRPPTTPALNPPEIAFAMDPSGSLASDIERALQHAVGQANNAFINTETVAAKKKKKRSRDQQDEAGAEGEVGQVKGRKKKRSKGGEERSEDAVIDPVLESTSVATTATEPQKKKKKKKDKGKHPAPAEDAQLPVLDAQAQTSAAFLNAVVSAASATAGVPVQAADPQCTLHQPAYASQDPQYAMYSQGGPSGYPFPPPVASPPEQPSGMSLPPELTFGSSEDILRALHDLDLTQIASVLKTLGDAATAANIPLTSMPSVIPPQSHRTPTHTPAHHASSSNPARPRPQHRKITNILHLPPADQCDNSEHSQMLATKWLSATKLAELAKTQGLIYKKGKFSAIEEQQLTNAIEKYKTEHGIGTDEFVDLVFSKNGTGRDTEFWSELTGHIPLRPIIAVYHHVRRIYHPLRAQGSWMPSEDDSLRLAVLEYGQQWEKVSKIVNRMASDCRDRYRNHLQHSATRTSGSWTKEEEDLLTQIVTDMTIKKGKDFDTDLFWGVVSQRMGNTRSRQQVRIKWTDSLSKTVKNQGQKPRWSAEDGYILVHKVDSLHVRDDSEIDWKTLPDPNWNFWSAHVLQRRWLTMKRGVKGHEDMTHAEIMDILRVKKAHLPPPPKQKVVSAEAVEDSEDDADGTLQPESTTGTSNATPAAVLAPKMTAHAAVQESSDSSSSSDDD